MCEYMQCVCGCPKSPEEDVGFPRARVPGGCELPSTGVKSQTPVAAEPSPQPFICWLYLFYFIANKMSADTINGGVVMGKKSLLLRILHKGMGETAQWLFLYNSQGLQVAPNHL